MLSLTACAGGTVARLAVRPEEGTEVIVTGRLSIYGGRSSYQIVIEQIEMAGEGALLNCWKTEERNFWRRAYLKSVNSRCRLCPVIGVVTSPTDAVIRDILHRLRDRFPRHVLLWPANVQGDEPLRALPRPSMGLTIGTRWGVPRPIC